MKKCVFAGTFDPPTLGHKQIVEDCLALFDEVVVALMVNPNKTPLFSKDERLEMLALDYADPRVKIVEFSGTAAELMQKENARAYVRGIRNTLDFEYENTNMFATQTLNGDVVPVYIPCRKELLHISSTAVRTLLEKNLPLQGFVTSAVEEYLKSKKK